MRDLQDFAHNVAQVVPKLTLDELAVLLDTVAVELVARRVVGVSGLAVAARELRRRADRVNAPRTSTHGLDALGELTP